MRTLFALLLLSGPALAEEPSPSGSFSIATLNSCYLASLASDHEVTVDWGCVDKRDAEFLDGKSTDEYGALAHVMKAIRDGKAKTQ